MQPLTRAQRRIYRPRPRPLDVEVIDGDPLLQISIYEQATILTRRRGGGWAQYPVAPEALAQIISSAPAASGLLPPDTLGVGRIYGQEFYILYIPPAVRRLQMPDRKYRIPLPPLIWAGCGSDYRIWALGQAERPSKIAAPLMVAPFPNCYKDGSICWGSSDTRPLAAPASMLGVLKLFLEESYFNLHVAEHKSLAYPNSVVAHWQELARTKAEAYPLGDLMPAEAQLAWALSGSCWGGK